MSTQIIPLKDRADSRIRAEFRPWRPLAFELRRWGYAARDWVLAGSSASVLRRRWPSCGVAEKARIGRDLFRSEDRSAGGKASNTIAQFALDFPRKESVCGDHGRRA